MTQTRLRRQGPVFSENKNPPDEPAGEEQLVRLLEPEG
jgi:hypothetical protein